MKTITVAQMVGELEAKAEKLQEALAACESWIDRWAPHVGACDGGVSCTCGRTAVLYEARDALSTDQ